MGSRLGEKVWVTEATMARHAGAHVAVYWGRLSRVLTSGQARKSLNLMRQSPGATSSTVMNHVLRWATSQSFWLGPSLQCSGRAEHSTSAVVTFRHLLSVPLRRHVACGRCVVPGRVLGCGRQRGAI